jgi:hypothetical protein
MKRLIVAAVAALALASCATPTPFQPATKHTDGEGYSEIQLEHDRWRVTFAGNYVTARQTVEAYMLFRAAQLTVDSGYDWFQTADKLTEAQVYYYGGYDGWWAPYGPYWQPYWTNAGGNAGYVSSTDWSTSYLAQTDILMHKGERPKGDSRAFDARDVIAHLAPHIILPKPEHQVAVQAVPYAAPH